MDYHHIITELLGTMSEANSIISSNWQLMLFFSLLEFIVSSLLYLTNIFSVKPFIDDMLMIDQNFLISSPPGSPEFVKLVVDLLNTTRSVISLQSTFVVLNYLASLLLTTTIIVSTTLVHFGHNEPEFESLFEPELKNLFEIVIKSLKRPFLTSVVNSMLTLGYLIIVLPIIASFFFLRSGYDSSIPFFVTTIFAYLLFVYFSMVWTMALIVSVHEEVHGLEALGKAQQLFKGMKVQGFVLNLIFGVVFMVLILVLRAADKYSMQMPIHFRMLAKVCVLLFGMYWFVAYTVFYYKCKKNKGEEVELPGSTDHNYTKLAASTLLTII